MIERMLSLFIAAQTARHDEEGQTVIEYALILAFVAVVAVAIGAGVTIETAVEGAFDAVEGLFT